ncbi:MAG TPA: glutamate--cysteine ligase [Streptosporangiales bacterium]
MSDCTDCTVGVEEEFHLVDAGTGALRESAKDVLAARRHHSDEAEPELLASQVELVTPVCSSLTELREQLVRQRRELAASAATVGCRLLSSGTYPLSYRAPEVTSERRYEEIAGRFGTIARMQVVCGCHVHVHVGDPDLAVAVMNQVRPWLPVLLALTANSPFWQGRDTGYASFRAQVWSQWPSSGTLGVFASHREYEKVMRSLVDAGVLRDLGMLYWDVRPSQRFDTLEFRIADACLSVDESVLLACLCRALTHTGVESVRAGRPPGDVAPELLRAARWRAARSGLGADLVDLPVGRPAPAQAVVGRLLDHVGPALDAHGDRDRAAALVAGVLAKGNGAQRQRAALRGTGALEAVLDFVLRETTPGDGA